MNLEQTNDALRTWAWRLGLGGLAPFVALALASWLTGADLGSRLVAAQLGYGAVILSFIGALHWGAVLAAPAVAPRAATIALGWSVVPALVGWVALLVGPGWGLQLLTGAFVVALAVDWMLYRQYEFAGWFLGLRALLTAIVSVSLLATRQL
ncbi:DUF3429 domain-containing protein [Burkholderiaceae bacterium FT117]|uniref:DUF3429 domain-containing protein n=1 Tax=Zeimonas sediminis TaxID=2944268 RepID=UPI002342EA4D|nr:DUF3429 domain-containing protein [Zeimonas sediminis]MCM5571387.1 DUF3429 domain-containing protein [Zeimonas sediminis]